MSRLRNDNGIALITALLFTLICLGIVMALLTIVSQGTKVSAANKTYKTAVEAGYGAVDVVTKDMLPAILNGMFTSGYKLNLMNSDKIGLGFPSTEACFNQKVSSSTALWTSCSATATTSAAAQTPDLSFNLKADNDPAGYTVYAKISDTRCGGNTAAGEPCTNSDATGIDYLDAGGGVTSSSTSVAPTHRPAFFRIEVQSQLKVNPQQNSKLSVLYAY